MSFKNSHHVSVESGQPTSKTLNRHQIMTSERRRPIGF